MQAARFTRKQMDSPLSERARLYRGRRSDVRRRSPFRRYGLVGGRHHGSRLMWMGIDIQFQGGIRAGATPQPGVGASPHQISGEVGRGRFPSSTVRDEGPCGGVAPHWQIDAVRKQRVGSASETGASVSPARSKGGQRPARCEEDRLDPHTRSWRSCQSQPARWQPPNSCSNGNAGLASVGSLRTPFAGPAKLSG